MLAILCWLPATGSNDAIQRLNPGYFGRIDDALRQRMFWVGLKAAFPGSVFDGHPLEGRQPVADRAPFRESLGRGIEYIRIYKMDTDLDVVREAARESFCIADLRYVPGRELEDALALFTVLTGKPVGLPLYFEGETELQIPHIAELSVPGSEPESAEISSRSRILLVVNRQTAGVVEAVIEGLRLEGRLTVVGTPTAGLTGEYEPVGHGDLHVVCRDFRAEQSEPLLGTGVIPDSRVAVTPEQDYQGYFAVENGASVAALLNLALPHLGDPDADEAETSADPFRDRSLQRAVELVIAAQLLGRSAEKPEETNRAAP